MLHLQNIGISGTLESGDIMITLERTEEGRVQIDLQSTVEKQFGGAIRAEIERTLKELGIAGAKVTAVDKGALDCTVRARVKAAAYRSLGQTEGYKWEVAAR